MTPREHGGEFLHESMPLEKQRLVGIEPARQEPQPRPHCGSGCQQHRHRQHQQGAMQPARQRPGFASRQQLLHRAERADRPAKNPSAHQGRNQRRQKNRQRGQPDQFRVRHAEEDIGGGTHRADAAAPEDSQIEQGCRQLGGNPSRGPVGAHEPPTAQQQARHNRRIGIKPSPRGRRIFPGNPPVPGRLDLRAGGLSRINFCFLRQRVQRDGQHHGCRHHRQLVHPCRSNAEENSRPGPHDG